MLLNPYRFAPAPGPSVAWNSADKNSSVVLSNGDLTASGSALMSVRATQSRSSGIYQFEVTVDTLTNNFVRIGLGRSTASLSDAPGAANGLGFRANGDLWIANGGSSYSSSYSAGDIIGCVYNFSTGFVTFYKNGNGLGSTNVGYVGIALFPMIGGMASAGAWAGTLAATGLAYPVSGATEWGA